MIIVTKTNTGAQALRRRICGTIFVRYCLRRAFDNYSPEDDILSENLVRKIYRHKDIAKAPAVVTYLFSVFVDQLILAECFKTAVVYLCAESIAFLVFLSRYRDPVFYLISADGFFDNISVIFIHGTVMTVYYGGYAAVKGPSVIVIKACELLKTYSDQYHSHYYSGKNKPDASG